jgi:predicted RNase H-like HicB family nuclease
MLLTKYNHQNMLKEFIQSILSNAIYTQEEDWWYIAEIPWYQGYFSQWDNIEEAKINLTDAIEWVILLKLIDWDTQIKQEIKYFLDNNIFKEYA